MTPKEAYFKCLSEKLESNYKAIGYDFSSFENKEAAKDFIIDSVSKEASIGFGGSTTLSEIGIIDYFRATTTKTLSIVMLQKMLPKSTLCISNVSQATYFSHQQMR